MNKLILCLALVAVSAACKSQPNVACKRQTNASVIDASQGRVPEDCHVTNEHRICDPEANGCCAKKKSARALFKETAWVGRSWWWLWGPRSVLERS